MTISQEQFNQMIYYAVQARRAQKKDNMKGAAAASKYAKNHYQMVKAKNAIFFADADIRVGSNQLFDLPNADDSVNFIFNHNKNLLKIQKLHQTESDLIGSLTRDLNSFFDLKQDDETLAYTFTEDDRPSFFRYFSDVYGKHALLGLMLVAIALAVYITFPGSTIAFAALGLSSVIFAPAFSQPLLDYADLPQHIDDVGDETPYVYNKTP
jgi:hypothetical protein